MSPLKFIMPQWTTCQRPIPVCCICGPADSNFGRHLAIQFQRLIPHPKVYFWGGNIGHGPHLEDDQGTSKILENF